MTTRNIYCKPKFADHLIQNVPELKNSEEIMAIVHIISILFQNNRNLYYYLYSFKNPKLSLKLNMYELGTTFHIISFHYGIGSDAIATSQDDLSF